MDALFVSPDYASASCPINPITLIDKMRDHGGFDGDRNHSDNSANIDLGGSLLSWEPKDLARGDRATCSFKNFYLRETNIEIQGRDRFREEPSLELLRKGPKDLNLLYFLFFFFYFFSFIFT